MSNAFGDLTEDEVAEALYNMYHDAQEASAKRRNFPYNAVRTPWKDIVQKYPYMADGWRKLARTYAEGASKI